MTDRLLCNEDCGFAAPHDGASLHIPLDAQPLR